MKRTNSQNIWLKRQKKDVFVKLSKAKGYRSRAAYKLIEINKKFKILEDIEIQKYLTLNEWKNKTGSYAIQGYGAFLLIIFLAPIQVL